MSEERDDNEIMDLTEEMTSGEPDADRHAPEQARTVAMPSSPFSLLVRPDELAEHQERPSSIPSAPHERASAPPVLVPVSSPTAVVARPIQKLGGGGKTRPEPKVERPAEQGTDSSAAESEPVIDLGAEYVMEEGATAAAGSEEAEPPSGTEAEPAPEPKAEAAAPENEETSPAEAQPGIAPGSGEAAQAADEAIVELAETHVVDAPEDAPAAAPAPEHPFDFGTPEMVFDEVDRAPTTEEAGGEEGVEGAESEEIDLAEAEDLTTPIAPSPSEADKVTAELVQPAGEKARRRRRRPREWWTRVFDDDFILLAPERSKRELRREIDFIEQALAVAPGSLVLDLACGVGTQAVALAKRNYRVVGVDLSLSMLARAGETAQEAGQKINFIHGDMRDLGFDRTFDAVYCIGTSFGFFDEESNHKVLEGVYRALKPGAAFLLEIVNRDYVIGKHPNLTWFQGRDVVCMEETNFNYINSRLYVSRQLILGGGARQSKHEYSIRIYSLHEIGLILHATGFTVKHVSGNIATPGVFFGNDSPRLIIRAERPA